VATEAAPTVATQSAVQDSSGGAGHQQSGKGHGGKG
jgi:hypothetical protein